MKSIGSLLGCLAIACFFVAILQSCERWELPSRKSQRNCGKPAGSLEAQIQQKKVDFSIANLTGTVDKITWDFGNGSSTVTTGTTVSYTYPAAGTYSVKATLSNTCGDETVLSRSVTVDDASEPSVSLQPATDISINAATLRMTVTATGNATITHHGVCYSSTNPLPERGKDPTLEKPESVALNTTVTFNPTNLEPNKLYYVRSFAVNQQKKTGYSSPVQSFRTGSKPAVSSAAATAISVTTAVANFVVTNPGTPAAIEYGICYSSSNPMPDVSNSPSATVAIPPVGSTTPVSLTGLNPNTKYYYRAFAKLASGEVVYGAAESFTTQVDTLAQDLIASISFTDGSRTDASGNNNHVTLVNSPAFTTDRKGKANAAIQLDGQNDYFYMTENSTLRPTSLSISIWIKPITVERWMQIYNKSRFSDGAYEMYSSLIRPNIGAPGIVINTDIKQNGNCQGGLGWQTFTFTSSIPLNTWHHVVMVYSGRTAQMYFDNVLLYSKTDLPKSTIDECIGGDLKFGAQAQNNPNYFYGAMDDIRIYKRALSAGEVQALYTQ
jgi:hypothetical protein